MQSGFSLGGSQYVWAYNANDARVAINLMEAMGKAFAQVY